MTWLMLILIPPLLWSLVNHLDKFIITHYTKEKGGIGGLIIFSTLFVFIVIPIIFIINPHVLNISLSSIFTLIFAGIVISLANILYLYALSTDETSAVIPFMQLIPVFAYFLGMAFLGEHLSAQQTLACLVIMVGAFIISLEFNVESKTRIKKGILYFGILSALFFAIYSMLFKVVVLENDFWVSLFWEQIGIFLVGVVLIIFVKRYRTDFLNLVRHNSRQVFFLNLTNELMTDVGNVIFNFATLLAPLAIVNLAESYQGIFVFIEGIIFTKYFPKFASEKMTTKDIIQKVIALVFITAGTAWLYIA